MMFSYGNSSTFRPHYCTVPSLDQGQGTWYVLILCCISAHRMQRPVPQVRSNLLPRRSYPPIVLVIIYLQTKELTPTCAYAILYGTPSISWSRRLYVFQRPAVQNLGLKEFQDMSYPPASCFQQGGLFASMPVPVCALPFRSILFVLSDGEIIL